MWVSLRAIARVIAPKLYAKRDQDAFVWLQKWKTGSTCKSYNILCAFKSTQINPMVGQEDWKLCQTWFYTYPLKKRMIERYKQGKPFKGVYLYWNRHVNWCLLDKNPRHMTINQAAYWALSKTYQDHFWIIAPGVFVPAFGSRPEVRFGISRSGNEILTDLKGVLLKSQIFDHICSYYISYCCTRKTNMGNMIY